MIDGSVCLIVNPHAGGGRALRLLPGVEAALRGQGLPFRVTETMSMQHARELAREACDSGEIVAAMGGDGIVGAVAGELRDQKGLLVVLPGGRGNDFARKLEIPSDPVEAVKLLETGEERNVDLAEANGTSYLGILSAGIDSDVSRIASRRGCSSARSSTSTGAAGDRAWSPADWTSTIDGEAALVHRLLRRGRELRRVRRRDVPGPGRLARRRRARRV